MKQVIVIRNDLKMGKGKIAAQAAHASVLATLDAKKHEPTWFTTWSQRGMKKITVKVNSKEELNEIYQQAEQLNLPCSLINDAGHTQLAPGTATAVAIGPAPEQKVDGITGDLKLL